MKKQINTKRTILWIIIGILILLVVYVIFFNGFIDNSTLSAGKTAGQVAYSEMVGGC